MPRFNSLRHVSVEFTSRIDIISMAFIIRFVCFTSHWENVFIMSWIFDNSQLMGTKQNLSYWSIPGWCSVFRDITHSSSKNSVLDSQSYWLLLFMVHESCWTHLNKSKRMKKERYRKIVCYNADHKLLNHWWRSDVTSSAYLSQYVSIRLVPTSCEYKWSTCYKHPLDER